MPNGGSDCCGTCWFNSTHEGRAGYVRDTVEEPVRCTIRDLGIEVPFWTYCVNHPYHNPTAIAVPIGPAYKDARGYPYRREIFAPSPDTEEIRQTLLRLLGEIHETPPAEYPTSPRFDEAVVYQLMMFGEVRAISQLQRIVFFDPLTTDAVGSYGNDRVGTVAHAVTALAALLGDEAIDLLRTFVRLGREAAEQLQPYSVNQDRVGLIRLTAVEGAQFCSPQIQAEIAAIAVSDPDGEIASLAKRMLPRAAG